MPTQKRRIAFVGAGKVGRAMGKLLHDAGYRIVAVACRSRSSSREAVEFIGSGRAAIRPATAARDVDVVFLTVPDRTIGTVCSQVAAERAFRSGTFVFHCSGSLTSAALDSARKSGAYAASLHPLQTFASAEHAVKALPGSYFGFEGDAEAEPVAQEIVAALKGTMLHIRPGDKALYHAASVAASNYMVATMEMAIELARLAGIEEEAALKALLPLIEGTVSNIRSLGLPDALTGPVARGDVRTVADHVKAIEKSAPQLLPAYKALGRLALRMALEKGGVTPAQARELARLFRED